MSLSAQSTQHGFLVNVYTVWFFPPPTLNEKHTVLFGPSPDFSVKELLTEGGGMWEVALRNITSKATHSEYWLLFYFIWMKGNIFKPVWATYESMACTREISLVHAGVSVMFLLRELHLHEALEQRHLLPVQFLLVPEPE